MDQSKISSLQFMERDGMHMKDGVGRNHREAKFKIPSDYNDRCIGGGFSWPPRSYTCSFCKREFRSAQALGGHMNVHRRDRARLRQSPSWIAQDANPPNLNPKPHNPNNPKPSYVSSAPSSRPSPITYAFPNVLSSPSSLACFSPSPSSTSSSSDARIMEMASPLPLIGLLPSIGNGSRTREEALKGLSDGRYEEDILGRRKPLKLDLEIGLCGNPRIDDLDLELRLGYS